MPRLPTLSRSKSIHDASIASLSLLDFLAPAVVELSSYAKRNPHEYTHRQRCFSSSANIGIEGLFYAALARASQCDTHQKSCAIRHISYTCQPPKSKNRRSLRDRVPRQRVAEPLRNSDNVRLSRGQVIHRKQESDTNEKTTLNQANPIPHLSPEHNSDSSRKDIEFESEIIAKDDDHDQLQRDPLLDAVRGLFETQNQGKLSERDELQLGKEHEPHSKYQGLEGSPLTFDRAIAANSKKAQRCDKDRNTVTRNSKMARWSATAGLQPSPRMIEKRLVFGRIPPLRRDLYTRATDFDLKQSKFAEGTHLPPEFFNDVTTLKNLNPVPHENDCSCDVPSNKPFNGQVGNDSTKIPVLNTVPQNSNISGDTKLPDQLKLLKSIRDLEVKLMKMKKELARPKISKSVEKEVTRAAEAIQEQLPIVLTKDDYMNLVDLYYHSHNSRFSPESTDGSPTPTVLDDYSFTLSSDFSPGRNENFVNENETYESPLKKVEEMLKQRQLREVAVMQVFVDLLLDDYSSNRALYEAYKHLPDPGVAYLPKGIIRLFMQRMSTPWTVSEKSMLRYLSLIDEMQKAQVPISVAEWSSAVYLAGRAFSKVTGEDLNHSLQIWHRMENEAGIKASHVTFNILFDIAVRSGRFALGETVLKEMHSRNLRLNRLGRVSLMYYHGLRKDGDGVRKAYRDFVEAGEIVDTLVLNCVIASLLNAQEPQAAEQVYARMKNMQSQLRKGFRRDGGETLYKRYPDPGTNTIDQEMASNRLGRVLEKAPRLQQNLPEHHRDLQSSMPLTPDHTTFRSMIAYHATTSGDLDRLTVLIQEMTDFFHLPLQTITFQLLFKGFALHGPTGGPESPWSVKRLELCWNACREAVKESQSFTSSLLDVLSARESSQPEMQGEDTMSTDTTLPSITQINAIPQHAPLPNFNPPLSRPPPRRLSDWAEFVLDLAAFPRERLKRLERFHATMFDAEDMHKPHEQRGIHTYQSPFFQSVAYTAPEPKLDTEEGEYELPSPSESGLLYDTKPESQRKSTTSDPLGESLNDLNESPHQVAATRTLVCWLLRAYARNTKSRAKVEEIWGQVRKVFKPRDAMDRESVIRVLRRCLRDCDREGSG